MERKKIKKDFKDYYAPEVRDFQCGFPTFTIGGFSFENLPTMHFKIHMFDFFKKLNYQMNSRKNTNSGKSVAEIEKLRGKHRFKKKKREEKTCENPACRKECSGYTYLKAHVLKKGQPKDCKKFYIKHKLLKKLIANAKYEKKFRTDTAKKTLLESILETAKQEFTDNIRRELGIKVNQIKGE